MRFGILTDEASEDYHNSEAIGSHKLRDIRPTPLDFYLRHISKELPKESDSPALSFGRYLHTLALEGESIADARYAISPVFNKRTKDGKADAEKFAEDNAGKEIIDAEDQELAWNMVKAIRAKKVAAELFTHGRPEVTVRHQMKSFAVQARFDWFNQTPADNGEPIIVDLKSIDTITDADHKFEKFSYYYQLAFYRMVAAKVLNIPNVTPQVLLVFVSKNAPYHVTVRSPDAEALDRGQQEVLRDLTTLKHCFETNLWPGTSDEVYPIRLSQYKLKMPI